MVKLTLSSSTNDCQNFFLPIFITDKALWIINALKKSEFKKGMDRNARNHKNKEKRKSNVNSETKIVVLYIYRKTEHKTKWTTTPETKSPGIFSFKWITNSKIQKNYKKRERTGQESWFPFPSVLDNEWVNRAIEEKQQKGKTVQ